MLSLIDQSSFESPIASSVAYSDTMGTLFSLRGRCQCPVDAGLVLDELNTSARPWATVNGQPPPDDSYPNHGLQQVAPGTIQTGRARAGVLFLCCAGGDQARRPAVWNVSFVPPFLRRPRRPRRGRGLPSLRLTPALFHTDMGSYR